MMGMIKGFKWVRPLILERWVDGDTAKALIDRGDGDFYRPKKGIRLVRADGKRYDAPELKEEPVLAAQAMDAALRLCPLGVPFVSTSHELDVYGRPVCSITMADGRDLATMLTELGLVKTVKR